MFELVAVLLLEDQQRSNKIVAFAAANSIPIWGACQTLFDVCTKNRTPEELEDLTLAVNIADDIYNYLP